MHPLSIFNKLTGSRCTFSDKVKRKLSRLRWTSGKFTALTFSSNTFQIFQIRKVPSSHHKSNLMRHVLFSSTLIWNPGKSRTRFHLSVLTGQVLAYSDSYRAAWPTLKKKRMDYDSCKVLKFPTPGQSRRRERSTKAAWYIHTNFRLWPLLLRSLFMNIISSSKIRATCLMSSSICVETGITGSTEDLIIPNWYFTLQTFTQICLP